MARRRRSVQPLPVFPKDFPVRLERLKEAGAWSWRELASRLGTDLKTVRRWRKGRRPDTAHLFALFALAEDAFGSGGLLLERPVREQGHDISGARAE